MRGLWETSLAPGESVQGLGEVGEAIGAGGGLEARATSTGTLLRCCGHRACHRGSGGG